MFQAVTFGASPFHPSKALENGFWNRHSSQETLSTPREDGVHWWGTNKQPTPSSSTCHWRPFRSQRCCCCVEKGQKVHRMFFYYSIIAVTCHGAAAASTYRFFNFCRGAANCHAACKLAGEFLYVLAWSQPEEKPLAAPRSFRCHGPHVEECKVGMWIKVIQMQVLSLGIRVKPKVACPSIIERLLTWNWAILDLSYFCVMMIIWHEL